MRKVTEQIVDAFLKGKQRTVGNSHTDGNLLQLHGNTIAWKRGTDGKFTAIRLSLAGWPTPTTRERLNSVCSALGFGRPFYQDRHRQYFAGLWCDKQQWYKGTPTEIGARDILTLQLDGSEWSRDIDAYGRG